MIKNAVVNMLNKMTTGMLWVIIVTIALIILMLTGACTYVILKSDHVTYEGILGKFSAQASTLQTQLDKALKVNDELTITVNQLKQNLKDINGLCNQSNFSAISGNDQNILSDKFIDINKNLKDQSNLLDQQKLDLKAINKDLTHFKDELQTHLKLKDDHSKK